MNTTKQSGVPGGKQRDQIQPFFLIQGLIQWQNFRLPTRSKSIDSHSMSEKGFDALRRFKSEGRTCTGVKGRRVAGRNTKNRATWCVHILFASKYKSYRERALDLRAPCKDCWSAGDKDVALPLLFILQKPQHSVHALRERKRLNGGKLSWHGLKEMSHVCVWFIRKE